MELPTGSIAISNVNNQPHLNSETIVKPASPQ